MNENRVVFVEGIPGSGKTSLSHKLMHEYEGLGYHVRLYGECQKNPLDLARCAMLSKEDFDALIVAVRKKIAKQQKKLHSRSIMILYLRMENIMFTLTRYLIIRKRHQLEKQLRNMIFITAGQIF